MVHPIVGLVGRGILATTAGKKVAKKFVKVKDLDGFIKRLKKKKTKTKDDIDNIKKGEDILGKKRNEEGLQLFKELKKARGGYKKSPSRLSEVEENPTTISPKATVRMKARGGKVKYNVGGIVNPSFSNKFKG